MFMEREILMSNISALSSGGNIAMLGLACACYQQCNNVCCCCCALVLWYFYLVPYLAVSRMLDTWRIQVYMVLDESYCRIPKEEHKFLQGSYHMHDL